MTFAFLARDITRRRWIASAGLAEGEIPADGLTGCMKTTDNALSMWKCDGGASVEDVVLARATGRQTLEPMDVVWLPRETLASIELSEVPGNTPVQDLRDRHVDLVKMDLVRAVTVARAIAAQVQNESSGFIQSFPRARVAKIIADAVRSRRVKLEDLSHSRLRGAIEEELRQRPDQSPQS